MFQFQHVAQVCLHYFQRLFNVVILTTIDIFCSTDTGYVENRYLTDIGDL